MSRLQRLVRGMADVLLIIQNIGTVVVFGFIIFAILKHKAGEYSLLTSALIAAFVNCFAYTLVISSDSIEAALALKPFDVMGSVLALYIIYWMVQNLCNVILPKVVNVILFTADLLGIAAVSTDCNFHLYYKSVREAEDSGFMALEIVYGPAFYLIAVSMLIQIALIIGVAIYAKISRRSSVYMMFVSFVVVLPIASMIVHALHILGHYNPTSLAMAASCVVICIVVHRRGKYDMVISARERVIETMDDALIVTDTKFHIIDMNPAAKKFFPHISDVSSRSDAASFVRRLVDEEEDSEFEIDGKYYEKHISKLYNSDGSENGYSVLVFDVTETQKYVEQLIEMRRKADMANNAKSDFLANMSHEIRTPMNAISGFAELCIQEKNYTYAKDIKTAAKNLISIINDILDISKIEAGKLELIPSVYDTEEMINDVISMIYIQLSGKENIDFKIDVDHRLPRKMFGDEVRLKQILINLLGNAVKFTKNGFIGLSVKELSRSNGRISLMFRISDSGIGIKKEDLSKLFENFQQVDTKKNREIEGTGLGLPISKELAGMMDGNITVESEYGKGSVFTVIVVQQIEDESPVSKTVAKTTISEEKTKIIYAPDANVLVVDDNRVNLDVTSHLLSGYGIKADLADCGRKAINMINTNYYDIVFMDHMMPELDGVDTTKIIRKQGDVYSKELPIVALTANAVSGAREMFLESGFNDFISKPIQIPLLEKVLETWLPENLVTFVERDNKSASVLQDDVMGLISGSAASPVAEAPVEDDGLIIPNVDVKAGLKLCGGNLGAYLAILKTFMETAEVSISRIENFAQSREYKDYVTEVHGLKSSSLAIGAKSLSEMAKALEMAGKQENYKQIMQDTPMLIARYADVVEHIKPFVETDKGNDENKPLIDKAVLKSKLGDVLEAIDVLDSREALKILDSLLEFRYENSNIRDKLENCRRSVDNFAYEKAEETARMILETI